MPRSIRIKDKIIRDRVARWVKEQREKMGIDIPEMAEKLGIDAKILENIENQSTISATSLLKIQAYFHFDPYLFLDKK